jgi:hypothetical protein
MSVERTFVYKTLVENLQYPAAPEATCMFDINCNNYQLYDELAKHNAFEFGDYKLHLEPRITYKFQHLPIENKELEKSGLFTIINTYEDLLNCLYFKRPFLYFGNAGYHSNLQSQGYSLYTKVIDYSFDCETNPTKRRSQFIDQVLKLKRFSNPKMLQKSLESTAHKNMRNLMRTVNKEIDPVVYPRLNTLQKFRKLL